MQKTGEMGSYQLNLQITLIITDKNNKILICVNLRNLWINLLLKRDKTSFVGQISDSVIRQDRAILLGYAALTQPTI